jgi:hypothetical protein
MFSVRPTSAGTTSQPAAAPVENNASTDANEVEHTATGPGVAADPVARFVSNNGLHPMLQPTSGAPTARGSAGGVSRDGSGREDPTLLEAKKQAPAASRNTATKCTAIAPKSYDVASTSQAEIDALKNATCGTADELDKLHRLGHTIENAKAAYADLLNAKPPVKIFVTTSAGNGGQPVMIVTGPKFDPSKAKTVYTHYHGDHATVADPLGSKAGQNARIRAVITNEDTQAVFVLPEAQNTTWSVDSPQNDKWQRGVSWSNVSDEVKTTDDALAAAGLTLDKKQDKTVVSMHSGGGMALVHLMWADAKGNNLRADRLELYDCVYHFNTGVKGKTIDAENYIRDWGKTSNGKACEQVIFYRAGNANPAQLAKVITEGFPTPKGGKDRFRMFDMHDERKLVDANGKIDDALDPEAKDADGKNFPQTIETQDAKGHKVTTKFARNFNLDSHYRTVGEFLGSKPRP